MSRDAEPREAGDADGGEDPSTSASRSASGAPSGGGEGPASFADLGLCEPLVEACKRLGWKAATPIQREAIPSALQGMLARCPGLGLDPSCPNPRV